MSAAFPRIYRSFEQFEREELRKLDSLRTTIDDMTEEKFAEGLDFDADVRGGRRRSYDWD